MDRLEKVIREFSHLLFLIGSLAILGMLTLGISDVFSIKLFNYALPGSVELVSFMQLIAGSFAIAHTQILGGHIRMDFVVRRLPERIRAGVSGLTSFMGALFFILLAWQSYNFGHTLQITAEVSTSLRIPLCFLVYAIAFSCIPVALVFLGEFLRIVKGRKV